MTTSAPAADLRPATVTAQLATISAQLDLASAAAHAKAHAKAHATASAHAKAAWHHEMHDPKTGEWVKSGSQDPGLQEMNALFEKEEQVFQGQHGPPHPVPAGAAPYKISVPNLVVHHDGTVADKYTKAAVGSSLSYEGGKWTVHHGDGTVSKHSSKPAALQALVHKHNQAVTGQQPAAPKPAAKPAAPPGPSPAPAAGSLPDVTRKHLINLWSTGYRYKDTSYATTQDGKAFIDELHRLLSTNKPPSYCGHGCQEAHQFLSMVDHDATVHHGELQRGISLSTSAAKQMFEPGKTVDFPVASWTTNKTTAKIFAAKHPAAGMTQVIIHTSPPAKGLDISALSQYKTEHEVVTGGRYAVSSVHVTGGVMNVYVTQSDFSAH